ncbi:ABC transporter substrate-binding protein [Streptomyces sp. NPDC047043]|uniref:ABC transporter substrate-binding protein n=1 Tax=Streptomyces sp. NPDC047043 TaxID=3154497 RepID=UPI0033DD710F
MQGPTRARTGRRTARVLALLSVLVSLVAGCTTAGETQDSAKGSKNVVTIAAFSMGNSLDPWSSWISNYAVQAPYDTLTRQLPDGEVAPWLATSWKYTDSKTLVLKLRDDVDFTDGTHFTAETVKANLDYGKTVNPKNQGDSAYLDSIKSVVVSGKYEVRIQLSQANPDLPWSFSRWAGWMVSTKALAHPKTLASTPVGSGPYILDAKATTNQQTYVFVKNPDYWAADKVERFDKLTVRIMTDTTAMVNAARAGKVDYLTLSDPSVGVAGMKKGYGGAVSILGLVFQDLKGRISKPLKDVRVRQALNYAVNRKQLLDAVQQGAGVVNGSVPYSSDSDGYSSALDSHYTYDPAKAKALLKAAGYPNGFTVKAVINAQFARMEQALAAQLAKVGVKVELSSHSSDIFQQTMSGKWAMATFVTNITGQTYSDVVNSLTPSSIYNPQKNSDARIQELLAQATATTDAKQRETYYAELAAYAQKQAWLLTPVLFKTAYSYNVDKIKIDAPSTVITPDLWYMSPAA